MEASQRKRQMDRQLRQAAAQWKEEDLEDLKALLDMNPGETRLQEEPDHPRTLQEELEARGYALHQEPAPRKQSLLEKKLAEEGDTPDQLARKVKTIRSLLWAAGLELAAIAAVGTVWLILL